MDEITRKRNKNVIETHLKELDIITESIIDELGVGIILTQEMLNDIHKLAFDKWNFLYKYNFIKKNPS